jgi:Tol biopolymer transport system component
METDGENLHRLTTDQEGDLHPAWSPDSSQIAFNRDSSLYLINVDGTNDHRLVLTGNRDRSPVWSPDGSQIAFSTQISTSQRSGSYIALMKADGSEISLLAPDVSPIQGSPSWSPDGHYLAFVASTNNVDGIFVVDMWQRSPPRKLVDNVYYIYHERWNMWSPDGSEIAFSQASTPVSGKNMHPVDGLYLVDVASGNIRKIDDMAAAFPVWQP